MKVIKLFLFMVVALVAGVLFNNAFAEETNPPVKIYSEGETVDSEGRKATASIQIGSPAPMTELEKAKAVFPYSKYHFKQAPPDQPWGFNLFLMYKEIEALRNRQETTIMKFEKLGIGDHPLYDFLNHMDTLKKIGEMETMINKQKDPSSNKIMRDWLKGLNEDSKSKKKFISVKMNIPMDKVELIPNKDDFTPQYNTWLEKHIEVEDVKKREIEAKAMREAEMRKMKELEDKDLGNLKKLQRKKTNPITQPEATINQ